MINDIANIPCDDSHIEPSLIIPKNDYDECDICSGADEIPQGEVSSDEEITSLISQIEQIAKEAEDEANSMSDAMSQCISGVNSQMEKMQAEMKIAMTAVEITGKLDELLDNLEPYEYYYTQRKEMKDQFEKGTLTPPYYSREEMPAILQQVGPASKKYSSAITVEGLYLPSSTISPNGETLYVAPILGVSNLTPYAIKYKHRSKLNGYAASFPPAAGLYNAVSNFYGTVVYEDVDKNEHMTGALYDEYYNKLDDPLNKMFTADERGLTADINSASELLKRVAANNKLSVDSVAAVKQGSLTMYIKDDKLFSDFFQTFSDRYDKRVLEIRKTKISPVLNLFKEILHKIAKYEAVQLNGSDPIPDITKHVQKIRTVNDSLKKIYADFKAKTRVDASNPTSNQLVKDIMKSASCMNGDVAPASEPEEFKGKASDTFAYGPTGMKEDSPNFTKSCYWQKFAKLATIHGLLPIPDVAPKSAGQGLRYWPVGLVIPTPVMLIKIPLPVIWVHLITVTTKLGVFVIFIGINGMIPCPYILFIGRDGIKQFIVTMRGPSNTFGYVPDESSIAFPIKIGIPWISTFSKLPAGIRDIMLGISGGGLPPFDEFVNDIKKDLFQSIDNVGLPKFKKIDELKLKLKGGLSIPNVDEITHAIEVDVIDWLDKVKLPKHAFPKDKSRCMQLSGSLSVTYQALEYLSKGLAFPGMKSFDMKQKIMSKISDLIADPDIQREINKLSKKSTTGSIDILKDEDWHDFRDFMKKTMGNIKKTFIPDKWNETVKYSTGQRVTSGGKMYMSAVSNNLNDVPHLKSMTWIQIDELMKSNIMTPAIEISNPINCKESLAIPPVDLPYLAAVSAAFGTIAGIIDKLSPADIIDVLGFSKFKIDDIVIVIYEAFNGLIPSMPLPDLAFTTNWIKTFIKNTKMAFAIDPPKIDISSGMLPPQVIINLNIIKPILKKMVKASIPSMIDALPIDIRRLDSLGFPSLTPTEIKKVVKGVIETVLMQIVEPVKVPYKAASVVFGMYRLSSISKNVMDLAIAPSTIPLAKTKSTVKMVTENLKNCFTDTMVVPPEVLAKALEALDKLGIIPWQAIAVSAAFGGGQAIRTIHPLLYEDDLPPWERLNNENMLLTVFLDEFCHVAKQQGGIYENYLP